mgnify:CR=1 FL=1
MALERSDVEKIAHLARLGLSEGEIPQTTATLNSILGLIDQLQAADTTGTFKYRKVDLVADGFDPDKVDGPVWVRGGKAGYQKLTAKAREAILSGATRL